MPDNKPLPTIFLSYAWANVEIANEIDNHFKGIGLTFRRDVRDFEYRTSIKEFMQQVGETDFVVMLISDEYLRSENCMHEVTELLNTHKFEKRILPVLLDNAGHIFNAAKRSVYYDYWEEKKREAQKLAKKYPNHDFAAHAEKLTFIHSYLGSFFQKITDLNIHPYIKLKEEKYKPMLTIIGVGDADLWDEVLDIRAIADQEDKEIQIDEFLSKHPNNRYGLFAKAYIANDAKQHRKSRKYYEDLLKKYHDYATAHYNLAIILENIFSEFSLARTHYEQAININPQYAEAHNNLAILLKNNFAEFDLARTHYETAIHINPQDAEAHNNLALLLVNNFSKFDLARIHFEQAININPQYANAHYNLAILLTYNFSEHDLARTHYEQAININPQFADPHYNLAILLKDNFTEFDLAKKHYIIATEINPSLISEKMDNYFSIKR